LRKNNIKRNVLVIGNKILKSRSIKADLPVFLREIIALLLDIFSLIFSVYQ